MPTVMVGCFAPGVAKASRAERGDGPGRFDAGARVRSAALGARVILTPSRGRTNTPLAWTASWEEGHAHYPSIIFVGQKANGSWTKLTTITSKAIIRIQRFISKVK